MRRRLLELKSTGLPLIRRTPRALLLNQAVLPHSSLAHHPLKPIPTWASRSLGMLLSSWRTLSQGSGPGLSSDVQAPVSPAAAGGEGQVYSLFEKSHVASTSAMTIP